MRIGVRILALALAIAAGAALFREMDSSGPASDDSEHAVTDEAAVGGAPPPAATPSAVERESIETPKPAAIEQPEVAPSRFDDTRLRVLVQDLGERPIEGARAAVFEADERIDLERVLASGGEGIAAARTDGRGESSLEAESRRAYTVVVTAEGYAREVLLQRYAGEEILVRLGQGAIVHGRITRAADGSGIPAATLTLQPRRNDFAEPTRGIALRATTNADGQYRFDAVAAGGYELEVSAPGFAWPRGTPVLASEGQWTRCDIPLEDGGTVRGVVIDAATKLPIADARVGDDIRSGRFVTTALDGSFEFRGFTWLSLTAQKPGYGDTDVALRSRFDDPLPEFVTVAMKVARGVRGRVVNKANEGIAGASVMAIAAQYQEFSIRLDWHETRTDDSGNYSIAGLNSEMRHVLVVRKKGFGSVCYDFPNDEATQPTVEFPLVALRRAGSIAGVVVDSAGRGVAQVIVEVNGTNADRRRFGALDESVTAALGSYVDRRETRSDERGRFAFADLPGGEFVVSARFSGAHDPVRVDVSLLEGERRDDLELLLDGGLSIRGRVEVPDGGALPTVYISVDSQSGGTSTDIEIDPDGSFRAIGLSACPYQLSVYPYVTEADKKAGREFEAMIVGPLESGRSDVVITLKRKIAKDAKDAKESSR